MLSPEETQPEASLTAALGGATEDVASLSTDTERRWREELALKRQGRLAAVLQHQDGVIYLGWDEKGDPAQKDPENLHPANIQSARLFPGERRPVTAGQFDVVSHKGFESAINYRNSKGQIARDVFRIKIEGADGAQRELAFDELTLLYAIRFALHYPFEEGYLPEGDRVRALPEPETLYTLLLPSHDDKVNGTAIVFEPLHGNVVDFQAFIARFVRELLVLDMQEGDKGYLTIARRRLPLKHTLYKRPIGKSELTLRLDERVTEQAAKLEGLLGKLSAITGRSGEGARRSMRQVAHAIDTLLVEDLSKVNIEQLPELIDALIERALELYDAPQTVCVLQQEVFDGKPSTEDPNTVYIGNEVWPEFGYEWVSKNDASLNVELDERYFRKVGGEPALQPAFELDGNAIKLRRGWSIRGTSKGSEVTRRAVLKEGWKLDPETEAAYLPDGFIDKGDRAELFV